MSSITPFAAMNAFAALPGPNSYGPSLMTSSK
uniref:Uncharacterized protein n=1 Tax=Romanomermis culicivorax TaxID=13658 RepID=A0A915JBS6_ROMCU